MAIFAGVDSASCRSLIVRWYSLSGCVKYRNKSGQVWCVGCNIANNYPKRHFCAHCFNL